MWRAGCGEGRGAGRGGGRYAEVMMIPHVTPPEWGATKPGRFCAEIVTEVAGAKGCRAALLGMPDDMGVAMNGGRVGAREGPRALREALMKFGVAQPPGVRLPKVFDAGDVTPGQTLEETHERVTAAAGALIDKGLVPIGIGGGHDLTYAFVRAACQKLGVRRGLYTDAHLDVRAEAGSGMPMRALIERCGVTSLSNVGIRWLANSEEHFDWFVAHGGKVETWAQTIPQAAAQLGQEPMFVSIDLDAIDSGQAPGVSALNPNGMTVEQVSCYAHAAGASEQVKCFDIMELNPRHDEQGRTARVAAYVLLRFLSGLGERKIG